MPITPGDKTLLEALSADVRTTGLFGPVEPFEKEHVKAICDSILALDVSGDVGGSGTANKSARWTAAKTLADGALGDTGSVVSFGTEIVRRAVASGPSSPPFVEIGYDAFAVSTPIHKLRSRSWLVEATPQVSNGWTTLYGQFTTVTVTPGTTASAAEVQGEALQLNYDGTNDIPYVGYNLEVTEAVAAASAVQYLTRARVDSGFRWGVRSSGVLEVARQAAAPSAAVAGAVELWVAHNAGGDPTLWLRDEAGADFGVGVGAPFTDATAISKNAIDDTKLLRFALGAFTTGTTRVATWPNADLTVAGLEIANVFTAAQTARVSDAVTAAITTLHTLSHNSSGTPTAGFGTGLSFEAETSTTEDTQLGRIAMDWQTATHASRGARFTLDLISNYTQAMVRRFEIDQWGQIFAHLSNGQSFFVRDVDNNRYTVFIQPNNGLHLGNTMPIRLSATAAAGAPDIDIERVAASVLRFTNSVSGMAQVVMGAANAAPTDANLRNNSCQFYLDEAGNALKVRVRYSDGTYKTGTLVVV